MENARQDLLRVLAMPFQLASVLFVVLSSLVLGFLSTLQGTYIVLGIFALWLMLVWLTNYALQMIEDAANGVRETATASAEMMTGLFADARAWIHPALALALGVVHYVHPELPPVLTLGVVAVLFPASLGAIVLSGRAMDALNPLAMARVICGLSGWYVLLALFVSACALLGVAAAAWLGVGTVLFAVLQLLLLLAYAGIGGAIYLRRMELGFEARVSPERQAERAAHEREAERQKLLDELYANLRVRETARAVARAAAWFRDAPLAELPGDLRALQAAGATWREPREFPRLLRGLLPTLRSRSQPGLLLAAVEVGLAAAADFAPAGEPEAVAVIGHALATGRKRTAARVLENFMRQGGAGPPGPELAALQERLR